MSGFSRVLRAELLRAHRTFTWYAVIIPGLAAVYAIRLAQATMAGGLSSSDGRWDGNVLGWLSIYPVALALPVGALVGSIAQWREQRCRQGGTAWRPVSRRQILAARGLVMALASVAGQAMLFLPVLGQGLVITHAGWGPVSDYARFLLLQWLAVTDAALIGMIVTHLIGGVGVAVAPLVAFGWSLAGAVQAESSSWLLRPWTWLMHGCVPLLGVHGNSTNLEPGASGWTIDPGITAVLHAIALGALFVVTWVVGNLEPSIRLPRRRRPAVVTPAELVQQGTRLPSSLSQPRRAEGGHPRPIAAIALALPWRIWTVLSVLLFLVTAATKFLYDGSTALALLALTGIPTAATVVGVQTWLCVRDAWRGLVMRIGPARLTVSCLVPAAVFLCTAIAGSAALAVQGLPLSLNQQDAGGLAAPVYALATMSFVAVMLMTVAWVVAQVAGMAWSISLSTFGLLASLLIAGNESLSGSSLWLSAPWGWVQIAGAHPQRWGLIVVLSLALAGVATVASALLARQRAVVGTD